MKKCTFFYFVPETHTKYSNLKTITINYNNVKIHHFFPKKVWNKALWGRSSCWVWQRKEKVIIISVLTINQMTYSFPNDMTSYCSTDTLIFLWISDGLCIRFMVLESKRTTFIHIWKNVMVLCDAMRKVADSIWKSCIYNSM